MAAVIGSTIAITASDGSARQRLAELTASGRETAGVADPQPDRERDGQGDRQRRGRDADVLDQPRRDAVRAGPVGWDR